jgi:hypothetical protein
MALTGGRYHSGRVRPTHPFNAFFDRCVGRTHLKYSESF